LFRRGTKIENYIGDKISSKEAYLHNEAADFVGYVVRIHKTQVVCHNHAMAGRCFASKANCPKNDFMIMNNTKVTNIKANAELVIHTSKVNHVTTVYLKDTQDVEPVQQYEVEYGTRTSWSGT
jgi:hypothetical protein